MRDCIVIGAGAAGMPAAISAAEAGLDVLLLEKNEKPGRKIAITGKGRCNVTNQSDVKTYLANVVTGERFMNSAIRGFTWEDTKRLIEAQGVPLKTERGNRMFPVSDKAFDIIDALKSAVKKSGARLQTGAEVKGIKAAHSVAGSAAEATAFSPAKFFEVTTADGTRYESKTLILATGGLSYETTGSTGDGHRMLRTMGVKITDLYPGLSALTASEHWCRDLMGLTLKNAAIRITKGEEGKKLYEDFGELLFTHFGVSGPVILSASSYLAAIEKTQQTDFKELQPVLHIDLKSALTAEQLDARILRDLEENRGKTFRNSLGALLPRTLIPVIVKLSGINPDKKTSEISRKERQTLGRLLKDLKIHLTGTRPISEAIITSGGVDTSEVNPRTMMLRSIPGLFVCGELLDVDCLTGGFNLQTAFATGHAAGLGAAAYLNGNKDRKIKTEKETKMFNVAIDGPGGAGKSSVAKAVAGKKNLQYVDTGALYRAIGYALNRAGVDVTDEKAVEEGIKSLKLKLYYEAGAQHVSVNGEDLTPYLRTEEAGAGASKVAVHGAVRLMVLDIEKQAASEYEVIMDGRDIGTVVLPDAALKIFITASPEERAKRRIHELEAAGKPTKSLEETTREIAERDLRDSTREIAPLRQADDAVLLDTTSMNLDEVIETVCRMVDEARSK